ncbi:hypothetical protein CMI38_01895 [Candidatus Pacearchaeota archaeon]|nr:hypothetical protein [Candidatus Pacearchaeota archaeon]
MDIKLNVFVIFLLIGLAFVCLVSAQDTDGVPESPADKITDNVGEYSEKGYPETYEKYLEFSNSLVDREQNKSYLFREWTGIFSENPVVGPVLYYTDRFFSFFDPLWEFTFGMEFNWSFAFFSHMFFWIIIIVVIFFPANGIFDNWIFGLLTGFVVASLTGSQGVIGVAVKLLDTVVNLWILTAIFIIITLAIVIYAKIYKDFNKDSEKEKLSRARKTIKSEAEVIRGD